MSGRALNKGSTAKDPVDINAWQSRKKRRSVVEDLEIRVGEGSDVEVYKYDSHLMAFHSHFIDGMIATDLREKATRIIYFSDINPNDWELMMMYLDVRYVTELSLENALRLVTFYDKYDFFSGKAICDQKMRQAFSGASSLSQNLDRNCDIAAAAFACDLRQTMEVAVRFFNNLIASVDDRLALTETHARKILPVLNHPTLQQTLQTIPDLSSDLENLLQSELLFPKYLISMFENIENRSLLEENVESLQVEQAGDSNFNGSYKKIKTFQFVKNKDDSEEKSPSSQGHFRRCERDSSAIFMKKDQWYLSLLNDRHTKNIYSAPRKGNSKLPPRFGWTIISPESLSNRSVPIVRPCC